MRPPPHPSPIPVGETRARRVPRKALAGVYVMAGAGAMILGLRFEHYWLMGLGAAIVGVVATLEMLAEPHFARKARP